jgi:putative transposase
MSTDVMIVPASLVDDAADGGPSCDGGTSADRDGFDDQLVCQLTERARSAGVSLTGEDGLLKKLTKIVLDSALACEMDAHLGW